MKLFKKIISYFVISILAIILVINIYNFISLKILKNDIVTINGYGILEVVSGSMEPTIKIGDFVIINTKNKKFKKGDIVTYKDEDGTFITHRIKKITKNEVITKGDANDSLDNPISKKSIVGSYVSKINNGGRIIASFKSPITLIMIFVVGILFCIFVSTDKNGEPIMEEDEKEFQEFLKEKNKSNRK